MDKNRNRGIVHFNVTIADLVREKSRIPSGKFKICPSKPYICVYKNLQECMRQHLREPCF